jgi:8-oxo-dGTP pyrophosphatase MutT (NUDIX family)
MREFNELAKYLTRSEPKMTGDYRRPRDAATLILLDRSDKEAKLLFGKRHEGHVFMPGAFVFPGGRLDPEDRLMKYTGKLDPVSARRLIKGSPKTSKARVNALALTAIRETCEETGILVGQNATEMLSVPASGWQPFKDARVSPNLSALTFFARAITPPGRPRRFDTRFFIADMKNAIVQRTDIAGPDSEFVELKWLTCAEALKANTPAITKVIIEEVEMRLKAGFPESLPASFFYSKHGQFRRDELI